MPTFAFSIVLMHTVLYIFKKHTKQICTTYAVASAYVLIQLSNDSVLVRKVTGIFLCAKRRKKPIYTPDEQ